MDEIRSTAEETITPQLDQNPSSTFQIRVLRKVRKITAVSVWLYLITKLFIFDIDTYIIQHYAVNLQWVLDYKFFIYIGFLGIIAALFNKWQVLTFLGYVLFYPIFLIIWIIPYAIFKSKSWIVAIAIINSVIRFFANFKANAIMSGVFVLSALALLISKHEYVVIVATIAMCTFLIVAYVLAVVAVFKPDVAFRVYSKVFTITKNHTVKTYALGQELALVPLDNLDANQLQKWTSNLEMMVLANRGFLFVASKFKAYQESRLSLIAGVFKCLWLAGVCVIAFAFINYGIFALDANQFVPNTPSSLFTLIYYSFKTFISNSITDLVPVKRLAEIASMTENVFGLFTLTIFVGTLLTQKNARQTSEISDAVKQIEFDAAAMEGLLKSEFRIKTIDEAIAELERLKTGMVSVVTWLTRSTK